jgi:hypothetical protein
MNSSPKERKSAIVVLTLLAAGVLSFAWIAFLIWLGSLLLKRVF